MSLENLRTKASQIKNETVEENNSANRIGVMFEETIEFFNSESAVAAAQAAAELANTATENAPKPIVLRSITTQPAGTDHIGDKYYNSTDKLIYTIIDTGQGDLQWDDGVGPRWQDVYQFNGNKYVWMLDNIIQADKGISGISKTNTTGLVDTYRITYIDGTHTDYTITNGKGISSITRTSGTGAAGTTDTYTITYNDGTTSTYQVVNGANGTGAIVDVTRTGTAGHVYDAALVEANLVSIETDSGKYTSILGAQLSQTGWAGNKQNRIIFNRPFPLSKATGLLKSISIRVAAAGNFEIVLARKSGSTYNRVTLSQAIIVTAASGDVGTYKTWDISAYNQAVQLNDVIGILCDATSDIRFYSSSTYSTIDYPSSSTSYIDLSVVGSAGAVFLFDTTVVSIPVDTRIQTINTAITALQTATSDLSTIYIDLSKGAIDCRRYADTPITIPAGSTAGWRIFMSIPIGEFAVGDVIKAQFKSPVGTNGAGITYLFRYPASSQVVGNVTWSSGGDGYYYSPLLTYTITQNDINNYDPFVLFLQAYNGAGLNADVISVNALYIQKSGYIDVAALRNSYTNMYDIATKGFNFKNVMKVKKNGTGDYTTIQAAINAVKDATVYNQYEIQVFDDFEITDVTQLWKDSNPIALNAETSSITAMVGAVIMKSYVHVRAMNGLRKIGITSPTNLTNSSYQYISTIIHRGNSSLSGFYVYIKGGRYAIHQDNGGTQSAPDYRATTIYKNLICEHKGTKQSDGYPSGAWSSDMAVANGTCSGQRQYFLGVKFITQNKNPMYWHSQANLDAPSEHYFEDCEAVCTQSHLVSEFGSNYGDIGSGQRAIIHMRNCKFPAFAITNNMGSTETVTTNADLYANGGADLLGFGNAKMLCLEETPNVLCFYAVNNNVSIDVTGGTAKDLIFGDTRRKYTAQIDSQGFIWGSKRIENHGSLGLSMIYSLPYRLGNCASVNKTLVVNVGGTDYTITFNQNYMTADASAFAWNTQPNISMATIISTINAIAPTVFQVSVTKLEKIYNFPDCMESGINKTTSTLKVGQAVVRDLANGYNCWKLAGVGDFAEGIVAERMNTAAGVNSDEGSVILLKKAIFKGSLLGITGMTAGTMYKCAASGTFATTSTRSEACLVALDNVSLISI